MFTSLLSSVLRSAACLCSLSLLVGCATLQPRAQVDGSVYQPFGETGAADRLRKDFKASLEAQLKPLDESEQLATLCPEVAVIERTLPHGIESKDNVITATAESDFDVLGDLSVTGVSGTPAGFPDYSSVGRKVLCYWQAPLTWVSLLTWMVVPISYPCWTRNLTRDEGLGLLRASAHAAGADTVVLVAPLSEKQFVGAKALLLRRRTAKAHPKTPSDV